MQELALKYERLSAELSEERYFDATHIVEGRLTLESGVALSTSDQVARSTLYFTPYQGSRLSLYTGTNWRMYSFSEISFALSGLTAGRNYDVFIYDQTGTLTLELTAWSSDTARATALVQQDGIDVRSGATTRRYLGTIRTTSATTTEDSRARRFVWNNQNPLRRTLLRIDSTDSWSYASDAWRAANGDASNRVEYVVGQAYPLVTAKVLLLGTSSAGLSNFLSAGIGVDSTTTNSARLRGSGTSDDTVVQVWGHYSGSPGLGYHSLYWLERANATSITIYGDNGDGTKYQTGLTGIIDG